MCVAAAIAGAGVVGGVASGALGASASKSAANTQAQAANYAADLQNQQFGQIRDSLKPYMDLGSGQIPNLMALLQSGQLNRPFQFDPTMAQLEQTPGYQFTLQQGLKGVDNAAAAKGLGLSGAQMKGISDYTTGLASQTYQQQYNNALQTFMSNYGINSDMYNRLSGLVGLGQNSAVGVGNAGMQTAANVGNTLMAGANASAAGQVGAANAISNGIGQIGSGVGLYSLLKGNNGSFNSGSWATQYNANDPSTYFNDPTAYG